MAGLIVLGGEMGVDETDDFPFLSDERQLLIEAVRNEVPVVGICLGGQLLAQALGAPVRRASNKEFGFLPVYPTRGAAGDLLLGGFEDGGRVFQWHQDVFDLPSGAALLLTGDAVRHQGFRVGSQAWGLQFHPEVNRAELEIWLDLAGEGLKGTWGKIPQEIRWEADEHLARQEERSREMFRGFARLLKPI